MEKVKKIGRVCLQVLICIQILIALIFIIRNIKYIPLYGDTTEFLELAQTMELDNFRPFVYPVVLRGCIESANLLHINYTYILYTLQNVLSVVACIVLMSELLKEKDKKTKVFTGLFLWSLPLNIHFNMSIKCDSLAVSFTILFLVFLIKFIKSSNWKNATIATIMMYIASNIRSEKIYFFIFVMCGLSIIEIVKLLKKKTESKKVLIGLMCILIVGTATTKVTQFALQKDSDKRAQPSFIMFLYERIVGGSLEEYYDQLPDNIKRSITYEDAKNASVMENNYKIVYQKLYDEDGNYDRIIELMKTMAILNHHNLITDIFLDFNKNMFPVYYLQFDKSEGTVKYTITRMEGDHPFYTDCYDLYATFLLYIIVGISIIKALVYKIDISRIEEYSPYILYSLISSIFFACLTSQNFHIRYVMPIYMIEAGLVLKLSYKNEGEKI